MITLITGTPGAGKTLFAVREIVEKLVPTGRPIYTDIEGLDIPAPNVFVETGLPLNWMSKADGAIFVFDEVQQWYPPRNTMSKVPPYISAYETHRHRGFDFYFVTQGPRLIDRHLHDLIGRHVHLYRAFGMKRATIQDWNGVNPEPNPRQSRETAIIKHFAFPKKYFQFYKSASVHTVKLRLPWKLIGILGGGAAVLAFASWSILSYYGAMIAGVEERKAEREGGGIGCAVYVVALRGDFVRLAFAENAGWVSKERLYNDGGAVYIQDSSGQPRMVCK